MLSSGIELEFSSAELGVWKKCLGIHSENWYLRQLPACAFSLYSIVMLSVSTTRL